MVAGFAASFGDESVCVFASVCAPKSLDLTCRESKLHSDVVLLQMTALKPLHRLQPRNLALAHGR